MTDKILFVLTVLMTVVGSASVVAAMIAPRTKTDKDDKLAAALRWVYELLRKLGLNDKAPALPPPPEEE